jgi:glycosyltransferase involved in cell wall biosynthesis
MQTFDRILAISRSAASDLARFGQIENGKVKTIGAGVDLAKFGNKSVVESESMTHGKANVLCVAGYEWRKNVPRLLRAWAILPQKIREVAVLQIVCSLNEDARNDWEGQRQQLRLEPDEVVFTGFIDDVMLSDLYSRAKLVIAPFLYEGFGLPVLEAMAAGVPVITSSTSALPEALEMPETTFDPHDEGQIASKIEELLTDDDLRSRVTRRVHEKKGDFSWQIVARRALAEIQDVARKPRETDGVIKNQRSITIVGPIEPSLSGVAIYTSKLIPHLRAMMDVRIFRDDSRTNPSASHDVFQLSAGLAGRFTAPAPDQRVLAIIGNSDYHHETFQYALKHPCSVWLHDLSLTGLVVSYLRTLGTARMRRQWLRSVIEWYGNNEDFQEQILSRSMDESYLRSLGLRFIEPIISGAENVFVNSHQAARIVALTGLVDSRRVVVLPVAVEPFESIQPVRREKVLISLGWLAPTKRPEVLIDALEEFDEETRLVFAGPIDHAYKTFLLEYAGVRNLRDRVEVLGSVSKTRYQELAASSALGIQLRNSGNVESSATVLDLLAARTPVVTDIPTCYEYPEGTVKLLKPNSTANSIARACKEILNDPRVYANYQSAANTFVQQHSFENLASKLDQAIFRA